MLCITGSVSGPETRNLIRLSKVDEQDITEDFQYDLHVHRQISLSYCRGDIRSMNDCAGERPGGESRRVSEWKRSSGAAMCYVISELPEGL